MHVHRRPVFAKLRLTLIFLLTTFACLFQTTVVISAPWQDHAAIHEAAKQFIEAYFDASYEIHVKVSALDNRLLLEDCQGPLHTFMPYNKPPLGAVSIGVRCNQPAWKVHVPAQVQAYTPVMVAKQPITRGALITNADVDIQKREISRYSAGIYTEADRLLGMVAKRNIRQADVLTPRMLMPRRLVSRGQTVTIIAEINGMQIRTKGEALMDGHQGQSIRVENQRSGKKITGEVIALSTVRIKM